MINNIESFKSSGKNSDKSLGNRPSNSIPGNIGSYYHSYSDSQYYSNTPGLYGRPFYGVNSDNYFYGKYVSPPKQNDHTSIMYKLNSSKGASGFGWGNNVLYPIVVAPSEVISISKI